MKSMDPVYERGREKVWKEDKEEKGLVGPFLKRRVGKTSRAFSRKTSRSEAKEKSWCPKFQNERNGGRQVILSIRRGKNHEGREVHRTPEMPTSTSTALSNKKEAYATSGSGGF